ncbi:MAG TPA: hypothetical protein VGD40_02740 [Chryseosolibacter sp.]
MKNVGKLFAALSLLMGFGAAHFVNDAKAEPSCPGSGQTCAKAADGTVYVKGSGY